MASAYTAFVFIQSNLNHGQKWYVKHGNKVCASCKRLYVFGNNNNKDRHSVVRLWHNKIGNSITKDYREKE